MAIHITKEYKGLEIPNAYLKIAQVNVQVNSLSGVISVNVYASKENSELGVQESIFQEFFELTVPEVISLSGKSVPDGLEVPKIEASNPLEWCYKWLMLKPEFEKGEMA